MRLAGQALARSSAIGRRLLPIWHGNRWNPGGSHREWYGCGPRNRDRCPI